MPKTFSQYFNQKALIDNLPFKVDFEISPVDSEVTEVAGGLEFKILNDLVAREEWFFSSIERINSTKTQEATMLLRTLSAKLMKILKLDSLEEATDILWSGSEKYKKNNAFVDFNIEYASQITELVSLIELAQDSQAMDLFRATFFILSRSTADWSLSKTLELNSRQITEIIKLATKEANGGINPEDLDTQTPEVSTEGK